jgi:transposase
MLQAPVPAHVIDKEIPTAGLLAQVLIAKYLACRYRHAQYYAAVRTMQSNSVESSKNTRFTSVYGVSSSA